MMPRPQKCRRVCTEPEYSSFAPDGVENPDSNILSVDEFEVIRLVDHEKRSHEQCAKIMDISRTTVTEIYERARYKIADALVQGKGLLISGGNYRICQGKPQLYCGKNCWKLAKRENVRKKYDSSVDVHCSHHEHEEGYRCGTHGCGSHSCHS
ncbi:MAG: DUF134 domain-containing protein [Oliverpabstia sp.]